MVHRTARDQFAELLRHFAAGQLTNDEFYDRHWEVISVPARRDKALLAIAGQAWFLYDDIRTHRLKGKWALSPKARKEVARWVLFLHSDLEYEWPAEILSFGRPGNPHVWPFFRSSDLDRGLIKLRLLAGGAR